MRIGATLLTTARGRGVGSVTSVLTPVSLSLGAGPSTSRRRICSGMEAFAALAERTRVAANLRVSLVAGLVGSALGAVATVLGGRTRTPCPSSRLCALCLVALWLLRRGQVRAAALTGISALLATVHVLLLLGHGIHDRATLLYPVIILVAALQLDRRLLVATTALCVLSAMIVTRLEETGALRTPWSGRARLAAPRGHHDHPRRHRGRRAPARRRHRPRDGRGARPGGAPGRARTASSRRAAPSSSASPTSCPTTSRAPW